MDHAPKLIYLNKRQTIAIVMSSLTLCGHLENTHLIPNADTDTATGDYSSLRADSNECDKVSIS